MSNPLDSHVKFTSQKTQIRTMGGASVSLVTPVSLLMADMDIVERVAALCVLRRLKHGTDLFGFVRLSPSDPSEAKPA